MWGKWAARELRKMTYSFACQRCFLTQTNQTQNISHRFEMFISQQSPIQFFLLLLLLFCFVRWLLCVDNRCVKGVWITKKHIAQRTNLALYFSLKTFYISQFNRCAVNHIYKIRCWSQNWQRYRKNLLYETAEIANRKQMVCNNKHPIQVNEAKKVNNSLQRFC